jgi:xanthine dehydrogenase accessory factor
MSIALDQLTLGSDWLASDRRVVCALLVEAIGSSPFAPGAFLLIDGDGAIEGSITGGCVEADVVRVAGEIMAGELAPRLVRYGVSDETAHGFGLACGGTIEVFIHELRGAQREACGAAFASGARGEQAALATLIDGPQAGAKLAVVGRHVVGGLGGAPALERAVARDLGALGDLGVSALRRYGAAGEILEGEVRVHLQAFQAPPTMLLVGAIDYSAAVAALAQAVGYRVVVTDAREAFAGSERFSRYATVRIGWPGPLIDEHELGPRDALILFSHDSRFDEPAILAALRSRAGYIGALGSRRTAAERHQRLLAAGADPQELERVHAPCGLDIGAGSPEEVAVSIIAEVIASRSQRRGISLRDTADSIRPR